MSKTVTLSISFLLVFCVVAASLFVWWSRERSDADVVVGLHPADTPTFNKQIAPIVFENCTRCHRPGESAPFSLLTYDDVKTHASQIVEVTESRFMPPWLPESGVGEFVGQRRLNEQQVAMIRHWQEAGTPEGEPADLPPAPQFPRGWQLGEPDLVLQMTQSYTLASDGTDVVRNFVIPVSLPERKFVRTFEFRPDNAKIVHHAQMMIDNTQACRRLDEQDSEPGFDGMEVGIGNAQGSDSHFRGWTPGRVPFAGIDGVAWPLEKQCDVVLQLHMLPSGRPEPIQSSIGLYFSKEPPSHHPLKFRLGSKTLDIPAGEASYVVRDSYELPVDVAVLGIVPHAHYLGKHLEAYAILPDGKKEWLIRILDWDFNWQDDYWYKQPVFLPRGSQISMRFSFDNSSQNVRNPNNPPQRVLIGLQSSDEMCDLWFQVIPRKREDFSILKSDIGRKELYENIARGEKMLEVYPHDVSRHYFLASFYVRDGRTDKAFEYIEQVLSSNPDSVLAHFSMGNLLRDQGKLAQAIRHYRKIVELNPDSAAFRYHLGVALSAQNKWKEASFHIARGLELKDDMPAADRVRNHVRLGQLFLRQSKHGTAITHLEQALTIDPEFIGAHLGLGEVAVAQGNWTEALTHFERARQLAPDQAEVHYRLGHCSQVQGIEEEAQRCYQRVLELDPSHALAHNDLAMLLATSENLSLRDIDRAIQFAEKAALLTEHKRANILDTLATVHAQAGNLDEAVKWQTKAIRMAPPKRRDAYQARLDLYRKRKSD